MQNKFDYDSNNDSIFISKKTENDTIRGSIVQDNINLDFTEEGKMVGIEIIGISSYLEEWGFDKNILNQINNAELIVLPKKDCIFYGITIDNQKIPLGSLPLKQLIEVQTR